MAVTVGPYDYKEYTDVLSRFDVSILQDLNDEEFVDFGIMDSRKYANKLLRLAKEVGLNKEELTMVVVLATAVKSKRRISMAMTRFKDRRWYTKVQRFIGDTCRQYTSEEQHDTFSVVHIPSCVPFLSSRAWLEITVAPTLDGFYNQLWAAQIYMDEDCLDKQRKLEKVFWNETVKKGSNAFEKNGFNEDYWKTKSGDQYPLLNSDGSIFGNEEQKKGKAPYTEKDIEEWLDTKSKGRVDIGRDESPSNDNDDEKVEAPVSKLPDHSPNVTEDPEAGKDQTDESGKPSSVEASKPKEVVETKEAGSSRSASPQPGPSKGSGKGKKSSKPATTQ